MRKTLILLVLVIPACTKSGGPEVSAPAVPVSPSVPGVSGHATLSGVVTFEGAPPAPIRSNKSSFPECARFARENPGDPSLRLSAGAGGPRSLVGDVFVWVKQGLPPGVYPIPAAPVTLDQKGCEFLPRVFGIRAGQPLLLLNSDPMLHNVHAAGSFNVPLPVAGFKATKTLSQARVVEPIGCDVHGWMHAYAGVVEHPFFAVTGDDGAYSIPNLPAGTYLVESWHERLGRRSQSVTLAEGESKKLDFAIKDLTPP